MRPFRQPSPPETNAFQYLPGLGGVVPSSSGGMPSPSLGDQFVGGSLVYAPPDELVPALYVEGRGYVPLSDPSIRPHLNKDFASLEYSTYVALLPRSAFADWTPVATVVRVEPSGHSMSFGPQSNNTEPIVISANSGWTKTMGEHEIFFLDGDCCVRQGRNAAQGPRAVVWIEREIDDPAIPREVVVYMESDTDETPLAIEFDPENVNAKIFDKKWSGRFFTTSSINVLIVHPVPPFEDDPAIYQRAVNSIAPDSSVIRQVQFLQVPLQPEKKQNSAPLPFRRVILDSRDGSEWSYRFDPLPDNPKRGVTVVDRGINLIVEGVSHQLLLGNVIDISADRAVVWGPDPNASRSDENAHYEVYLEGNIIFRDGERRIEAHRMYYDTKDGLAYILDAKLVSPIMNVPGMQGAIRLQAETIQQIGDGLYTAKNGFVSSSMLGEPTSSLHSKTIKLDESNNRQVLIAENNYVAIGKLPIFYWPWMAADLKDPTTYLTNITYGTDTYDGQNVRTNWNPFQILNIRNRPAWLDADLELKWIEKRGFAHGVNVDYTPSNHFDTKGFVRFWGISDSGRDRLGGPRSNVDFPNSYRYRLFWRHTQELFLPGRPDQPWTLNAKVGKTSDHNFLNNYFLGEWEQFENQTTSLELKKLCGNSSISILAEYALDDFYTNANWLPRAKHNLIGESLLGDRLTWYEQTRIGFVNYHTATPPYDAQNDAQYTRYLPWELRPGSPPQTSLAETINTSGMVFSTRHELDVPFNIGPVRCVPFVLGDFSYWSKDRHDKGVDRLYGQTGVRLNLPFWKVFPQHSSRTWYVNGLAHKIDFDTEFSYARSNRNMEDLILYDSLDTWSIEDARRRYWETYYGVYGRAGFPGDPAIPKQFDPRYYALRSGMGGRVTASNMEIADDMMLTRFGMTHRFQTKRGPVGKRRIIDWITVSTHFNYYPEARHNFGETIGLIDYDFLWNVGDRFAFFSSGIYDVFELGQNITRIGGTWQRPGRGRLTLAVDQLSGLIRQDVFQMNTQYYFNEKYSVSYSTAYDMASNWRNLGHNFTFIRTGESFRLLIGTTYQEATDKWGFSFGIEPVFLQGIASKMNRMSRQAIADTGR